MKQAREIVDQMYSNDAFSIWLGIERLEERAGYSRLQMTVREEMTNGFGIAHGGITYSLADSALAFASNSHGLQSMSIETAISHTRPVKAGDILTAETEELNQSKRLAIYEVRITNQDNEVVALFKGTVFRTEKPW
ncbi:MAG TPA: hydroxyphenylacetyl-CoA thioesterase PaaI [Cryomorphaceae bacterium]|nr:phenylacetic acid degradation protein PaaD [Owenweeksia sp.]MBF98706.1 phenylacetic acid degradation protein PaaD [Owenweeksia sp.]HAD97870.1 hydroxyphenylacetyl-CoA thioesterase PaaI [Cryomorphaceae bacterium]HCQ15893.1 hydroxyphenylacetyl-CoA thioesterase PaaI [Cryomorphaceae bacterium]|tara:strand:- start:227 stop:634 length:408 start_codon:yes stop_codon:yes gene_type:complete